MSPQSDRERFARIVGGVLRSARHRRGLTLRDVDRISRGSFKPTSVAGYERGERTISLQRFCDLSQLYAMRPGRLLVEVERADAQRPPAVLRVTRIPRIVGKEAHVLSDFASEVRVLRGEQGRDTITLRSGDLEVLAALTGRSPDEFLELIAPALAG